MTNQSPAPVARSRGTDPIVAHATTDATHCRVGRLTVGLRPIASRPCAS